MGTMKGIYKGFKYISNIFVVKEKEMEIGTPTDVKHVAHIGWDGQSTSAPSWMGDFKGTADPTGTTISNGGGTRDPNGAAWSSQDYDDSIECQPASELFKDTTTSDIPKGPKKHKRKKPKNSNSPRSSKSTRALKTKASTCGTAVTQAEQIPIQHELTPH